MNSICERLKPEERDGEGANLWPRLKIPRTISQGTFYGHYCFNGFPSQFFETYWKKRKCWQTLAYFNICEMSSLVLNLCETEHDALKYR